VVHRVTMTAGYSAARLRRLAVPHPPRSACDAQAMAQIGSLVLNVTDIERAATFWRNALGYVPRAGDNPGALVPERGKGPALLLDETDRTHLDLHAASEKEQQTEIERLISLGARRVDWVYPDGAHFVVLSDTEGNLFCVVNTHGGQRL
jgi:catechol 2,3-dioxygenase-like lactoylglutathione lyase family enzyme